MPHGLKQWIAAGFIVLTGGVSLGLTHAGIDDRPTGPTPPPAAVAGR